MDRQRKQQQEDQKIKNIAPIISYRIPKFREVNNNIPNSPIKIPSINYNNKGKKSKSTIMLVGNQKVFLFPILVHEIGHTLGFPHVENYFLESIMKAVPNYKFKIGSRLPAFDRELVIEKYGERVEEVVLEEVLVAEAKEK